jgi:ribose transport system ATP-binding protein
MGSEGQSAHSISASPQPSSATSPILVKAHPDGSSKGQELVVRKGEVIGLAGLAGHGQTRTLLQIFSRDHASVDVPVSFIAGDRQSDGVFNLWSIARNVTIRSLKSFTRFGLIDPAAEARMAEEWKGRMAIRTPDMDNNILTLSGGNQQKALFARALASDATVILMDDPMRGVDIGTKLEVYDMIRKEAANGRSFVWYTTEFDELAYCDRVYVFRNGKISDEINAGSISEERILQASFAESAA